MSVIFREPADVKVIKTLEPVFESLVLAACSQPAIVSSPANEPRAGTGSRQPVLLSPILPMEEQEAGALSELELISPLTADLCDAGDRKIARSPSLPVGRPEAVVPVQEEKAGFSQATVTR